MTTLEHDLLEALKAMVAQFGGWWNDEPRRTEALKNALALIAENTVQS